MFFFRHLSFKGYEFVPRGLTDIKGKGKMETYFLYKSEEREIERPDVEALAEHKTEVKPSNGSKNMTETPGDGNTKPETVASDKGRPNSDGSTVSDSQGTPHQRSDVCNIL